MNSTSSTKRDFVHSSTCPLFLAANGPVGIECPHGYDVCPMCDPCTCLPEVFEIGHVHSQGDA